MDRIGKGVVSAHFGVHSGVLGEGEKVLGAEVHVQGTATLREMRGLPEKFGEVVADGEVLQTEKMYMTTRKTAS